jgi:hypothetical protein
MATIDDLKNAAMLYDRYEKLYDDYNDHRNPWATVAEYDTAIEEYNRFANSRGIHYTDIEKYRQYKGE